MSSPSDLKANGARLIRLIVDVGTKTLQNYFDSIHPRETLTDVLYANYDTLRRNIPSYQMQKLFPPTGVLSPKMTSTSKDYDITLLFSLLRNICGLRPPTSIHGGTSWDEKPSLADQSPEAHLAKVKYYRNKVFAHIKSVEVSDDDFVIYWSEISKSLVNLGANAEEIRELMTKPVDEDYYLNLIIGARKGTITIIIVVVFLLSAIILAGLTIFFPGCFDKELDHSYPQNFSNPDFVGREWVFRQMEEEILNRSHTRGVLLVAEPGWGKSAIMKHLISSSSSSAVIHDNIIGHHICKFNDKSTRNGGRFVKNLVQLIGKKIPEYREIVSKDQLIKDILKYNCNGNPVECFQTAIVEPLQNLDSAGRKNSFILIDALDECMEKEETHQSIIVNILIYKVPDLPNWVKLIVTSRNHPMATSRMLWSVELSKLTIDVKDKRGEQDLHTYANRTLQSFTTETLSNEEILRIQNVMVHAVRFCKGNFLFLDTIMKNWKKDPAKINADSILESLEHIYAKSFTQRFTEDNLVYFQPFLEILLATYSPLTFIELEKILNYHVHGYFAAGKVANSLFEYFKADINQGPLEFYHQFFAEWLVNQTEGNAGIEIKKSRGHKYIFDYLLNLYEERQSKLTFEGLSELCAHFLNGKKTSQSNLRRLGSLKVSEIRDYAKRCILHDLASKRDATELVAEFFKQFNSVDILDIKGWTPAMYAVKAGNYENVELFMDNGANVSHAVAHIQVCDLSYHLFDSNWNRFEYNMFFLAVRLGYVEIAKLLIARGWKIEKDSACGWRAVHLAAMAGRYEIVQLCINHGAQPDIISLHHAAAKNHTEIVCLLLDAGVRDECLSCEPQNMEWCDTNIKWFHLCMCETALHAAVSRNNLEMAKLILQYGNNSVNCRHGSGRTTLMEAFSQKNIQMVELLISAGADINAKCKRPFLDGDVIDYESYMDMSLYSMHNNDLVCDGNPVIDYSFAYGLWKVMTPFISKGKLNISLDNARRNLATVAVIYDRVDFINATYGYSLESIPNIEAVLRYVAVCHSVKTLKHLLSSEDASKFATVYEDGKTLLHFAILGSVESQTEIYMTESCPSSCICPKITHADISDRKRLVTIKLLAKVLSSDINKQDKFGRTALHYAVVQVLPEIVKCLINAGADWSVKDIRGDTALEYALREIPYVDAESTETFLLYKWTSDHMFEICQSTVFDELASYLLSMQTITECDKRAKTLLSDLVRHRLPLSLHSLFTTGLDVNCAREHFSGHLQQTVFDDVVRAPDDLLGIFKIFDIDVQLVCGAPFRESRLHLMAYYLRKPSFQIGDLFKSPDSKSVEILNECYDEEGYLPIHRAVQGGNTYAVSWFIEIGVDITRKTKSGLTILAFAIRWSFDHLQLLSNVRENNVLEQILKTAREKNLTDAFFQCNNDISPLHVAASNHYNYERGLDLLQHIAILSPEESLTCTNCDGIQPFYLERLFYHESQLERAPWLVLGVLPKIELLLKHPEREVEYHLIYNYFYCTPQDDLRNVLNDDSLFKCPGINDLLPNETEIQKHLRRCSKRCWPSAVEASRKFSSNYLRRDIQNNISNTDKLMDIASHMAELRFHLVKTFPFFSMSLKKNLWRKITKAHSCAFRCSCFEIMKLLQEKFTSRPLGWWNNEYIFSDDVSSFLFERMGWTDTSSFDDVKYRWPFRFLLKKALKKDKAYNYLQILNPKRKFGPWSDK